MVFKSCMSVTMASLYSVMMMIQVLALFLVIDVRGKSEILSDGQKLEAWTGRWLPEHITKPPPVGQDDLRDATHGVKMGIKSDRCDDAKTNLTMDWDNSPINFTCFAPVRLTPNWDTRALLEYENIPKYYEAHHCCMNETINYKENIPTFGTHRPLWPKYGEYRFVPRQRWLHNLEHGAVVMLYDPCAHPVLVEELRILVVNCLHRHVITPYTLLDPDRPLALVTWGARLTMSTVSSHIVQDFIKQHALHGPEKISRNGQYDLDLIKSSEIVSDTEDILLCPNLI